MKLHSGHYLLMCIALLTTVASGFGYFILYGQVVSQAQNSSKALEAVKLEQDRKAQEGNLIKIHADTTSARTKLLSSFVYPDKVVDFIEEVEAIGTYSSSTLELSAIATEENRIRGHVNIKGGWSGVMRSLTMIENLPYSISIKSIKLSTPESPDAGVSKTNPLWTLSLDFSVLTL